MIIVYSLIINLLQTESYNIEVDIQFNKLTSIIQIFIAYHLILDNFCKNKMDQNSRVTRTLRTNKLQKLKRNKNIEGLQMVICQIKDEQIQSMRMRQLLLDYKISPEHSKLRTLLFYQLLKVGIHTFSLKNKTIELTMRIFDYYCYKSNPQINKIKTKIPKITFNNYGNVYCLQNIDQGKLALSACLFLCAKYNEIYPPNLNDICYFADDKFSKSQILGKQVQILTVIEFAFDLSTISNWYQAIFDVCLPTLALQYYANQCVFNAQNFAIGFAYSYTRDKNSQPMSQSTQFKKFKVIIDQIDTYKEKIYQNDKYKSNQ